MFFEISKVLWFIAAPSNALILAALAGLILSATRFARLGRRVTAASVLTLSMVAFAPVGSWLLVPLEERFPPWPAYGPAPDGIVVLGGPFDSSISFARGRPAINDAAERLTEAAELARRFPGARVVFTGGLGTLFTADTNESDDAARVFAAMGLAPERLTFERESRNTHENAVFTRRLVAPKPGERWLLVTSAWHMPRSIGTFRAAGFAVEAYPVDYRARGPADLWRLQGLGTEGLRRFETATREWIGLVAYRITGRTDALFPAP
jgi:uncharacterized SAM-binding protein YcdF (DUF218 family)